MSVHFHRQLEKLKRLILSVGAMVEESVAGAVRAIETRDVELAQSVIQGDESVDLKEIEVEEECLATLALHQPVAHDLRFIVAVLKMNNDLERIGDLARSIAEQAVHLAEAPPMREFEQFGIYEMARLAQTMLKQSLDSLVELDVDLAKVVRKTDDDVDDRHKAVYAYVERRVMESPEQISRMIRLLTIARSLERVADHAVNIAKDVIYLVDGKIVRHRGAQKRARKAAEALDDGGAESA